MSTQLIVPATQYTPLPKRFDTQAYGWIAPKKQNPLPVKPQLPNSDLDELHRLWEDTDHLLESERWEDQQDFKNAERQMGKVMHSNELVKRILKLNKNLICEDSLSMKGNASFYLVNEQGEKIYSQATFTKGWVPEFTIMYTDTADRPVYYPKYGWRCVLVRLLKRGYISYRQVLKVFGEVHHHDSRGRHWKLNTAAFR